MAGELPRSVWVLAVVEGTWIRGEVIECAVPQNARNAIMNHLREQV